MKCNTCQNEDYCYDGNHEILRLECKEKDWCCFVPITNADRIRAMTDEELADFLMHICDWNWMDWLKSPVEEVDNGT